MAKHFQVEFHYEQGAGVNGPRDSSHMSVTSVEPDGVLTNPLLSSESVSDALKRKQRQLDKARVLPGKRAKRLQSMERSLERRKRYAENLWDVKG